MHAGGQLTTRRPPTILVDASDINQPSGARTAVYELMRALLPRQPGWRFLVLVSEREAELNFPNVRQIVVPFRKRVLERLWIQLVVTHHSVLGQVDLVHFARTMGGFSRPAKSVLTMFDLTTVLHPELHSRMAVWYWRHIVPFHLRWADRIIAISKDVADGLSRQFHVAPEKIQVVPCAPKLIFDQPVSPQMVASTCGKYHLPATYLLFVGMLARKKNLLTLLRALELLRRQEPDCPTLVLAGRKYHQSDDSAILGQTQALGLESHVRHIGPVSDDDLPGLYGGALVFVFPSLHEGFGIPCLEAMRCGTPVVAARSGAIPEIVGDAALLLDDPTDPHALAQAIQRAWKDTTLRLKLITAGQAQAGRFSWARSSDQVLAVYSQLLEKRGRTDANAA